MLVIQSQQTVRNLLSSGEEGTDFVISVLGFLLLSDLIKEALNHLGFFSYLFRLFYWIMENYLWKIIYGKLLFMENTQLPTWCALQLSGVSRSGARTGGLWLHQLLPLEGAFLLLGPTWDLVHLGLPTLPGPLPTSVRTAGLELAQGLHLELDQCPGFVPVTPRSLRIHSTRFFF